jgi:hypothetical protein
MGVRIRHTLCGLYAVLGFAGGGLSLVEVAACGGLCVYMHSFEKWGQLHTYYFDT